MKKEIQLITFGRACIDLNPIEINRPLEESLTFAKYVGGSPVNIAIGCARLGVKVGFIGKLAKDQHGKFIYDFLKNEDINLHNIVWDKKNHKTGLTFLEIKSKDESSIMMYRDSVADLYITAEEINEDFVKSSQMVLISGTSLSQSPSREAALKLLQICEENSIEVIFELDYRPYNWKNSSETATYYNLVASRAQILIGTREEFEKMNFDNLYSDKKIAEIFLEKKSHLVVIKRGVDGSQAFLKSGEVIKGEIFKTKVLKSFGAGDSFASAFIKSYLDKKSIKDCLTYASASASIVISSHSSSSALPKMEQLEEFLKARSEENE